MESKIIALCFSEPFTKGGLTVCRMLFAKITLGKPCLDYHQLNHTCVYGTGYTLVLCEGWQFNIEGHLPSVVNAYLDLSRQ